MPHKPSQVPPRPLTPSQLKEWFTLAHQTVNQGIQKEAKVNLRIWQQLDHTMQDHLCSVIGVAVPTFTLVEHDVIHPNGAAWATLTELHAVSAPNNGQLTEGTLFDWSPDLILYDRLHSLAHELGHHVKWTVSNPLRLPVSELSRAGQGHLNRHLLGQPNAHGAAQLFDELFVDAAAELMMGALREYFSHQVVAVATTMRIRMRQWAFSTLAKTEGVPLAAPVVNFEGVTWGWGHESYELLPDVFAAQAAVRALRPPARLEWLCRVVSAP